jgi:hypothetical protein
VDFDAVAVYALCLAFLDIGPLSVAWACSGFFSLAALYLDWLLESAFPSGLGLDGEGVLAWRILFPSCSFVFSFPLFV